MKTNKFTLIIAILILSIIFNACNDSNGPTVNNNGGNSLAGAYILYYTPATSTDYAYYDAVKDSVTDFVFTSNNPGVKLNVNPGEMKLNSDRKLYITTLGIPGNNGTIYKIDPLNNTIVDSLRFGSQPNGFDINNNRIVVGNSGSTNVTVLDLDFNIIKDTIETGPVPDGVLYGFNKYIVYRRPLNSELSLAIIDEINYGVSKLNFPGVPLDAIYNVNGIFVSTTYNTTLYRIESESFTTSDSSVVPSIFQPVNDVVFRTQNSFYAICGSREIWLAEVQTGAVNYTNIFPALSDLYIRAAEYEQNANELYIIGSTFSGVNTLMVIDGTTGSLKRSKPIAGFGPLSIIFRYF